MAVSLEQLQAAISAAMTTALQARGDGQAGVARRRQRLIMEKDFRRVDRFDGSGSSSQFLVHSELLLAAAVIFPLRITSTMSLSTSVTHPLKQRDT